MSVVRTRMAAAGALALALSAGYLAQGTFAAGIPANKVAASGSETEVSGPNVDVILLSETVKINNPTDLIVSASAECSIVTQVKTTGSEVETATARIVMWVTIDGVPVPVSDENTDKGEVVFCDRVHQQETNLAGDTDNDDNDDTIRTYLSTRTANAFNWMALNVGRTGTNNNVHKIELHARLETQGNPADDTFAQAVVGNRTLILEPVKASNREAVTELN
jgi:hypothetical protein